MCVFYVIFGSLFDVSELWVSYVDYYTLCVSGCAVPWRRKVDVLLLMLGCVRQSGHCSCGVVLMIRSDISLGSSVFCDIRCAGYVPTCVRRST
jgi:hypothetical protein